MKLIRNFFWNVGYQIFVLLVPLVTVPYINRVLGPTGVGINAFTNSIVQYFVLLGSLGINLYGSRGTAYVRDDKEKLTTYFWELTILRIICISVALIAFIVFAINSPRYRLYYFAQSIMLIGAAFDISWFFQGMENFKVTVLRNILVKAASLLLIFILVRDTSDTLLYILILGTAQLLGNLSMWPSIKRYVRGHLDLGKLKLWKHIRPSIGMLVPQLANQIYVQLNKTMLGILIGVTVSGYYDNSDKIIKMLLAVVTATGTVLLPNVANSFAHGDKKAVQNSLNVSMHYILVVAFPLVFGLIAIAKPFTFFFFSVKFMPVANLLAVESLAIIPITIASAIGVQYLLPTDQVKGYTVSIFLGSFVNIVLNIPLILGFGAMGAIVGTVLSEVVVTSYQVFYIRHQIDLALLFQEVWKYALSGALMCVFVSLLVHVQTHSILFLIFDVLVGASVYAVVLIVLKPRIIISNTLKFIKRPHD